MKNLWLVMSGVTMRLFLLLTTEVCPDDLRAETCNFYNLFYHRTPDERQLNELLSGTAHGRQ